MNPRPALPRNPAFSRVPALAYQQAAPAPLSGEEAPAGGFSSLAFWACTVYTFLLISRTIEVIDDTGRLHLAIISGVLCLLMLLITGNLPKMLISRQGKWISLLCFWIFLGLPFSSWKGGSIHEFQATWLKSYLTFFMIGGLIFSLKQFRMMTLVMGLGTAGQVYLAFRGGIQQEDARMSMTYGSLGNANDLASALLIGFPFMVFVILDRKANSLLRVIFVPVILLLMVAVLKTGSRGGLLAIVALVIFGFLRSSGGNRMKIIVGSILLVCLFAAVVPSNLRDRYLTIFKTQATAKSTGEARSALESTTARKELFVNAFILTARHPVFGVGLGQFSPQSFNLFVSRGVTGMWYTCHDVFGLVSSETGIPGLIFFCGVIVVSFKSLSQLTKIPQTTPELILISRLAVALLTSLVAYVACGVLNTQAFSHQLPVIASLAAALERVAAPYIAAAPQPQVAAAPFRFVNRRLAQQTARTAF